MSLFNRGFVMGMKAAETISAKEAAEEREREFAIATGRIPVISEAPVERDVFDPELAKLKPAGEKQVISNLEDIPEGAFFDLTKLSKSPLSEVNAESFAAILHASIHTVYVLYAENTGARMLMEVVARVRAEPQRYVVLVHKASADIIRIVNERSSAQRRDRDVLAESDVQSHAHRLLEDAEMRGASDIHLETRSNTVEVFYRVHGKRMRMGDMSLKRFDALGNFLHNWQSKDSSREANWNKQKIQDVSFAHTLPNGGDMHVRFHSTPIHPGGNSQIVMRLLRPPKSAGGFRALEDILYSNAQKKQIVQMLAGGSGAVLVVGPTNSGKSSSLQSYVEHIRQIRGPNIKISTIENPVEYEMVGACQMAATEADFNEYLRATLRQDPDVVVVGEIRGADAADTTKSLILAGHKILTTLHVYEAVGAFSRLMELGVPRPLLAMPGFVSGVVYQRLLPVVCQDCCHTLDDVIGTGVLDPDLEERLTRVWSAGEDTIHIAKAGGCEKCHFHGYVGRMPVAEVLKPDTRFLELIREGRDADAKDYWQRTLGVKADWGDSPTALAHAITQMKRGLVDPRDIEAELSLLDSEI